MTDDSWCYGEGRPYSIESLGNEAWLTGCPLCGDQCWERATPEQHKEAADYFSAKNGEALSDLCEIISNSLARGKDSEHPDPDCQVLLELPMTDAEFARLKEIVGLRYKIS
jgi:hypothetical protein